MYYRSGRAGHIKIKDDANPNNVISYTNAKLQLTKKKGAPKVYIMLPPENDVLIFFVMKFYWNSFSSRLSTNSI